ncbi:MAG: hypothetical protein JXQ76_07280 [Campylobacterales bacterium]|nr:hypothetical protein [Campylobacterales bacterium]
MPKRLDELFYTSTQCKEHNCKVERQNIKQIYKPDKGFLDKQVAQKLFGSENKICDCIIECENEQIIIVEILCGKLTQSEIKDKKIQLENCCKVVKHIEKYECIKKIILFYDKLESSKKQPMIKKALINQRICNKALEFKSNKPLAIGC